MSTSTSTQKTNVLEYTYDYFTIYSSTSTITLEYKHDYFNEYHVSNIKATFMESLGVIVVLLLCHYNVLTDYCYPLSRCHCY